MKIISKKLGTLIATMTIEYGEVAHRNLGVKV